ncbi:MucB/RseB C-terminal domain-containing protein [Crenobacter sp. SG2303]|uniref:MucB/RseB C-terminal domain-containing protein n=1 Tax=Crenobacter oryzisoli TaxID=3056844 RepID=A0ABT7XSY3_9NEIS|nr:MucB/RseB C-terminal domain-containing protein [Crenobacter sp. SG2303]MDN0076897.1 MucB/RseB C-terminal domain-containing protein [Crenobacter sp. SG2303]
MHRICCITGGVLLGVSLVAHAGDDWQPLRKAAQAGRQQPLNGTYLHQMSGALETFQVYRGVVDNQLTERRESLDGLPREILRQGNDVTYFAPDARALTAARYSAVRLFPAVLPDNVDGLAASYTVKRLGSDRVARHDCDWYLLKPNDGLRYNQRFCLDSVTGMPLKAVMLLPRSNEVAEQYTFTDVELTAPKDRSVYKSHYKLSYTQRGGAQSPAPSTVPPVVTSVDVTGLPPGFKLLRAVERTMPSGDKARHLMYTDGLVMLSLFVEPQSGDPRPDRANVVQGALSIASHSVDNMQLTLVGDLPEQSLASLLRSIKVSLK